MKVRVNFDCIPCFQRQVLQALRFLSNDRELHEKVLREVIKTLLKLKWDSTPPEMSHEVHKIVRRLTQNNDPYRAVKKKSNDCVLKIYPELKDIS